MQLKLLLGHCSATQTPPFLHTLAFEHGGGWNEREKMEYSKKM
jgi:hypothetical protein